VAQPEQSLGRAKLAIFTMRDAFSGISPFRYDLPARLLWISRPLMIATRWGDRGNSADDAHQSGFACICFDDAERRIAAVADPA
jgi:hypothetical protein